jgi:hypothetical protein
MLNICGFGNYPLRESSSSQLFMCFSIVSYLFRFSSRLISAYFWCFLSDALQFVILIVRPGYLETWSGFIRLSIVAAENVSPSLQVPILSPRFTLNRLEYQLCYELEFQLRLAQVLCTNRCLIFSIQVDHFSAVLNFRTDV